MVFDKTSLVDKNPVICSLFLTTSCVNATTSNLVNNTVTWSYIINGVLQ